VKWLSVLLVLFFIFFPGTLEGQGLDWDINSIFDEPFPEDPPDEPDNNFTLPTGDLVRRQGFTFDGSYEFYLGLAPGWMTAPWYSPDNEDGDRGFSWFPSAKMRVKFDLDAQISEVFRAKSSVYISIPGLDFSLGEFFFDYSLYDRVFFRGGKYYHSWGFSPNYAFTNLLARVPDVKYNRDAFLLKADVPLGVGGIQFLTLTRVDLMQNVVPVRNDVGYGSKLNLAFRRADIDIGTFYQDHMAWRNFLSIRTTFGNTELYNEYMLAVDRFRPVEVSGAANLGFIHEFFGNRFFTNGELFFNSERDALLFQTESNISEAQVSPFIDGLNIAANLLYRFRGRGSPRIFLQALYAPVQESAQLVPGFRLSPWNHIELYLAVPMALGSRDGYYYHNTIDPHTPHRPFSIVFLFTLTGSVTIGQYR